MARGTEMKNVSAMLTMLLRLRQVCDHPYLIRMLSSFLMLLQPQLITLSTIYLAGLYGR